VCVVVLQSCAAACCSVLQCVVVYFLADLGGCALQCCSVLQRVAACCSVLQCVAVSCVGFRI